MRAVPALLVLLVGCIAAEPSGDDPSSRRTACTDLEGMQFLGGDLHSTTIAFLPDDSEYSSYTQTTSGEQTTGLVQCTAGSQAMRIFVDGADRTNARLDRTNATQTYLQWTDGSVLAAY